MAGGRIDGAAFVLGLLLGSALFSELFELIKPIYKSGAMGRIFLYDFFGLPLGITIFLVTGTGIAFIAFFNFLEKTISLRKTSGRSN